MAIEVEVKFQVADPAAFAQQLARLPQSAPAEPAIEQSDRYFNHPARDFAQTDEAFRIRSDGSGQLCFTYKGPKLDAETKTRCEIELPIEPSADALELAAAMLAALGFREVANVLKRRTHQTVEWQGRAVEVVMDLVQGVGSYVELEVVTDEAGAPAARALVLDLASHLGLTASERRSYLEMLLANRAQPPAPRE